jgi:RNA polymerase sigma factor (sigma-70 family)
VERQKGKSGTVGGTFVAAMEKTHGRALRRYFATRMRRQTEDIPDLMQEVYLRLLRIPDYESIRNPQAYLFTIASHVLHQYALRRSLTPVPIEPLDINSDPEAPPENDPAEEAQLEQRYERLGSGLEQHSPRAYATLLMYRCEGLTLEEIGKRFGVSRTMAKKYLIKAMTYCHERLEEMQ